MTFGAQRFGIFSLIVRVVGIALFAGSSWGQYTSGDRIICTTATRARPNTSLTSTFDSIAVNTKGTIVGGPYSGSGNTLSWFLIRWDTLSADRYTAEFDGAGTRLFAIFSPSAITLATSQAPYWDSRPPAGPVVPLQWNQSQRAQYFEIYRNGQFYTRIDNPNATSFTNNVGLSAGATYTFLVAARRNDDPLSFTQSNTLTLAMPSQPQAPPSVTTNGASGITVSTATLNLTVNPNGTATTAFFEYGPTTSYGSTTTPGNFGSGNSSVSGSSVWSGLQPNTTYHYRAVASNSGGTSYGNNVTFDTLPPPLPTISRIVAGQSEDNHIPASSVRQWVDFYGTNFVYNSGFQARLTWPAVNGLADYKISSPNFESINSTHFRLNILVGTSAASWPEPWQVRVTSSAQDSALHNFFVLPYPELFALQSLTTAESNGSPTVTLNWGASSFAEWYIVERDGITLSPTLTSGARSYTDNSPLNRNQSYSYRVKAINKVGSIKSNSGTVTIPAADSPVLTITSPSAGSPWPVGSNIIITWTLSGVTSGVTGQKLSILNNDSTVFGPVSLGKATTSYSWTVPSSLVTSNAAIKVETAGAVTSNQVAFITTGLNATSPPLAVISLPDYGSSYSPLELNKSIRFSGASSKGNPISYQWVFSDGGTATGVNVNHTFTQSLKDGKGTAKLTVTSQTGSHSASIQFSLKGAGNNPTEGKSLDPVNTATGAFLLGFDVMPVEGRGVPFLFQGYYNSMSYRPAGEGLQETPPGSLGYGWTHSFETRIEIPAPEDGVRVAMISFGDGHAEKYTMAPGDTSWQAEPGVWNQLTESLEGRFSLLTLSQLRHDFDVFGKLAAIVDRNGNKLDIVWEDVPGVAGARRIQKVVLPGGPDDGSQTRAVLFTYRPAPPALLWKLEDPMHHFIEFTQNAVGDLVSWTNERNHTTHYTYDPLHQLETGRDGKNQQFVRNYYNADRRVWKQEDPSLDVTLFTYDFPNDTTSNRLTTITRLAAPTYAAEDDRNEVTVDVHDPKLRRVQQRVRLTPPPTETWLTETWAYDPVTNDVTTRINRRGKENKFGWSNGNLIRVETPDGAVRTLEYGDPNNPTLPTLITFPDARVKEMREYDEKGNLTAVIFPYDATQPTKNKRSFTVDVFGQVKIKKDANGVAQSTEFNVWGRPYQFTDGESKVSQAEFDDNGRQTASISPLNHRVDSIFNAVGNLIITEQADPNDPANPIVTTLSYDENEQLIQSTDQLLHHTYSHRDVHGRVWKSEDHDRNPVIHRFDAFGREVETENAKGGITRRTYNFAGYVMSESSPAPSSNVNTYKRDANGNATELTDGDGVRTTFEYDSMDRVIVTRRWKSATEFDETRTSYNLLGQKEWDEDEGDSNGVKRKTFYYYNLAGDHIRTVSKSGIEFTFAYDDEGNLKSATHTSSTGNATRYQEYNGRYQLKKRIDENGHSEEFFYDDAGNLSRHVQESNSATPIETAFVHDSLNRLTRINPPTGPPITFIYDKASRRIEMSDPTGTTKWSYSTLDQVASIEMPNGLKLTFSYDPLGATEIINYPGDRPAKYVTDAAGRFQSVTDWENRTISQTYTAGDRPLRLQFPNGVRTDLAHDPLGRLNVLSHQKGTDPALRHLSYGFNALGKVDSFPDVQLTEPDSNYTCTYGKANELLTIAGSPVTHDGRGNLKTGKLSPASPATDSLTWDYANRLTNGTIGAAPFSNTFNGLGHRTGTTRSGVTTGFLHDDRHAMPRIMAETDAAGAPTAYYLYAGDTLLARILPDGTALWYHPDRQGNIVLLTDGSGSTAADYQYDPNGILVSASGSFAALNRFRYLGGLGVWDNDDGTLHARARSYHPRLGSFLSNDLLFGSIQDGQSLNRYVYALGDPFGFSDPSGFVPVNPLLYSQRQPHWTEAQWVDDAMFLAEFSQKASIFVSTEIVVTYLTGGFSKAYQAYKVAKVVNYASPLLNRSDDAIDALNVATKNRVKPRKSTLEKVDANQPRDLDGNLIDPNTRQPLKSGEIDLGHKPGNEWRRRKSMHEAQGSTRKEVIEAENNPDLYQWENRSTNRSRKYEQN